MDGSKELVWEYCQEGWRTIFPIFRNGNCVVVARRIGQDAQLRAEALPRGIPSPPGEPAPTLRRAVRRNDVIRGELRRRRAGVVGQDAQPRADREALAPRRPSAAPSRRATMPCSWLAPIIVRPSSGVPSSVADLAVAVVALLRAACRGPGSSPSSRRRRCAQPFSGWWPITVVSTDSAMSSGAHTPTLAITRSKNT